MSDVSSKKTVSIHKINKNLSRMKALEKELKNVDAKRAVRFQLLHTFMKNYSTKLFLTRQTTDSVSGEQRNALNVDFTEFIELDVAHKQAGYDPYKAANAHRRGVVVEQEKLEKKKVPSSHFGERQKLAEEEAKFENDILELKQKYKLKKRPQRSGCATSVS